MTATDFRRQAIVERRRPFRRLPGLNPRRARIARRLLAAPPAPDGLRFPASSAPPHRRGFHTVRPKRAEARFLQSRMPIEAAAARGWWPDPLGREESLPYGPSDMDWPPPVRHARPGWLPRRFPDGPESIPR